MKIPRIAAWFVAFALLSFSAAAAEVHGVKLPDAVTVEGKVLKLNGMGVRTKSIFNVKVYVAGLYLENASADPERIIATDGVRRLVLVMTHEAPRERLRDELVDGFERNSKGKVEKLQGRLTRLLASIPDSKEGHVIAMTYVPGRGTTFTSANGVQVTLPGKDFADALVRAWLGKDPLDADLKTRLLGTS
jgi:hypothetical protein